MRQARRVLYGFARGRSDPLNLNMRYASEIGILGKDHEPVPDRGRCDPRVHCAGTASRSSGLRNDRREGTCDLGIDGDRVEFALNPADGAKAARPVFSVFGT
jgi:hypothetical protein